jgi:hypothetical protein
LIYKTYPVSLGRSRGLLWAWRAVWGEYSELYETIALLVCRQLARANDAGPLRLKVYLGVSIVPLDLQRELFPLEQLDSGWIRLELDTSHLGILSGLTSFLLGVFRFMSLAVDLCLEITMFC